MIARLMAVIPFRDRMNGLGGRVFETGVLVSFREKAIVNLRLGELPFDSDTRQLLRRGAQVHLSPKAFDLLKVLIDHRPRVLSKHELHEHLWPATFVSDANLASLIAEIREALRDTPSVPPD